MDLSKPDPRWLVLGMLRSVDVLDVVLRKAQLEDFEPQEVSLRVAYIMGSKWRANNRSELPWEVVLSLFENEILKNRCISLEQGEAVAEDLQWAYSTAVDIKEVKNFILDVFNSLVLSRKIRKAAQHLDKSEDILDSVGKLNKTISNAAITKTQFLDPFGDVPYLNESGRIPWGVDFVDVVTSGGALPGETTLFLAPSGGGKTLTSIQLATQSALNGEQSLVISYEQSIKGIAPRMYAYAMGIPVKAFEGHNPESFFKDKVLSSKFQDVQSKLRGRIRIVDQLDALQNSKGGSGGSEEIREIIRTAQDEGFHPRYVGIDWLGPMVNNYMAVKNIPTSSITQTMATMADELRKVGLECGVNLFIYHQLGTEASQSTARKKPQATDAFQCRSLHQYMDTVICIGNRDSESHIAWMNAPKVRNGQPYNDTLIRMEGELSRWRLVDRADVNLESMKMYGSSDEVEDPVPPKSSFTESNDLARAFLG